MVLRVAGSYLRESMANRMVNLNSLWNALDRRQANAARVLAPSCLVERCAALAADWAPPQGDEASAESADSTPRPHCPACLLIECPECGMFYCPRCEPKHPDYCCKVDCYA